MSGWGSWLTGSSEGGAAAPAAAQANFKPISDLPQDKLFGPLKAEDLQWTCAGGFTTETQTWYSVLADGAFATTQIIHSAVGLWYPQIQLTFKYFNPKSGEKIWKSINVSGFTTPAPAGSGRDKSKTYDKRSCKADQFTVLFDTAPNGDETYTVEANFDSHLQLSWTFTRPAACAGWKLGEGPTGGKSIFGSNPASPDGYVVHRFWPRAQSQGHIISNGQAIDGKGQGMFVHAIQGMRPNLVASTWNFANFQSEELGGVAAIMMEFTTTRDYGEPAAAGHSGRKSLTVNIGSITVGDKLVAVTAHTGGRDATNTPASSSVSHKEKALDPETGYQAPTKIDYHWSGPIIGQGSATAQADLALELGQPHPAPKGLVDKVDVLAEIPYVVRKLVNVVAGTKPYIYQTLNPAELSVALPEGDKQVVKGTLFEEHTFINV